jgi:hypothetical protein
MDIKVEAKLLKLISPFIGQTLKHGKLKVHNINKKDILTLELTFSDQGLYRTMVLALDKDITENDYKKVTEKLLSE